MRVGRFIFSPRWFTTGLTVCLLVLLIWLGTWQVGQAERKRNLQLRYDTAQSSVTLRLEGQTGSVETLRFHRVEATGIFDNERQFLLDNRTHEGTSGYHVLTPLRLDKNSGVLVNRGWVPTGRFRDILPDIIAPKGQINLVGKLFPPPRVFLLGSAGYEHGGWPRVVQSVNFQKMESLLGYKLVDGLIMMSPNEEGGYVRVWTPYYGITPQRHQAYATQWFCLAIALLVIYAVMTVRKAHNAKEDCR